MAKLRTKVLAAQFLVFVSAPAHAGPWNCLVQAVRRAQAHWRSAPQPNSETVPAQPARPAARTRWAPATDTTALLRAILQMPSAQQHNELSLILENPGNFETRAQVYTGRVRQFLLLADGATQVEKRKFFEACALFIKQDIEARMNAGRVSGDENAPKVRWESQREDLPTGDTLFIGEVGHFLIIHPNGTLSVGRVADYRARRPKTYPREAAPAVYDASERVRSIVDMPGAYRTREMMKLFGESPEGSLVEQISWGNQSFNRTLDLLRDATRTSPQDRFHILQISIDAIETTTANAWTVEKRQVTSPANASRDLELYRTPEGKVYVIHPLDDPRNPKFPAGIYEYDALVPLSVFKSSSWIPSLSSMRKL